jgi:hypothetical protein
MNRGRSNFTPLGEHSRFPVSMLDEGCATEGAAHDPVSYEQGIRDLESDPWVEWAIVIGVVLGASLSAWDAAGRPLPW